MLNCSVKGRRENQHLKITVESAVTVLGILHTSHFISKKHSFPGWFVWLTNKQKKPTDHLSSYFSSLPNLPEADREGEVFPGVSYVC